MFLADRVAVFSARPGTIKEIITVDEPHPRKPDFVTTEKFSQLRNTLYGLLHDEIRKAGGRSRATVAAGAHERASGPARQVSPAARCRSAFLVALLALWYLGTTPTGASARCCCPIR